jgi:hypothetical protein
VDAQFVPPVEQLAFKPQLTGEANVPGIFSDPLPTVVHVLRTYNTYDAVANNLPDIQLS